MKRNLTIALIVLFVLSGIRLFAQNDILKENRPVKSFSGINVSGIAHVYLTKGDAEKVDIETNSKELSDRLIVEVVNDILVIRMKPTEGGDRNYRDMKLRVDISYRTLNSLEAGGATNVFSQNTISTNKLDIKISGANNTMLAVQTNELNVKSSGAANLTITGTSPKVNAQSSGASNIKAYEVGSQDVVAETSGTSNVFVTAGKSISAKASGVSNINYKGNATLVNREVSRMANISKR